MNSAILWPQDVPAIVEMAEARDRRECIALNQGTIESNRKLAQWLTDHPTYTSTEVAKWLECSSDRIRKLRQWARNGFDGSPFNTEKIQKARERHEQYRDIGPVLKSPDNFQDDDFEPGDEMEEPAKVLTNILDSIKHAKGVAEAYRKILKSSPFDSAAKAEIHNAINLLIVKWRRVQSTLDTKGQGNGKSEND